MARKMTEWPSKRRPLTNIRPSDGCKGDAVPLAVDQWYDLHEFECHLGNVGKQALAQLLHPFTLFAALAAGLGAAVFCLGVFWVRWRLVSEKPSDRTFDLAMHANRALAVLHALIMALVFAEAQIDYTRARESVWREADLLRDVFRSLDLYDSEATEEISVEIAEYTQALIHPEWKLLSENRISPEASSLFQAAYSQALQLKATTPAQEWLYDRILEDLGTLTGLRHARFFQSHDRLPFVFWLVIVLGFVLLCCLFSVYERTRANLAIGTTFSFFFGVVSYLIFAFQDPFDGHLKVTAQPMILVYEDVMVPTIASRSAAGTD